MKDAWDARRSMSRVKASTARKRKVNNDIEKMEEEKAASVRTLKTSLHRLFKNSIKIAHAKAYRFFL